MVKNLTKFIFLFSLSFQNLQASDKDFLALLPKPVFTKLVGFLDIESIGRMMSTKSLNIKIVDLKRSLKEKHTILDTEQVQFLENHIKDFNEKNKEISKSISPFLFSTFLMEQANQNQKLQDFMNQFITTILNEKQQNTLVDWQSMMIRKKILRPFLEQIIKKEKKQKWETIFERELFANEKCLETRHPYYILPFVFFGDMGVSMNYQIKGATAYNGTNVIEFAAGAGFSTLVDFLLKKGAKVNRHDSTESCLYLSIYAYLSIYEKDENCDEARKTIFILLQNQANKDHFIPNEQMTVREYVMENVSDIELLENFKN